MAKEEKVPEEESHNSSANVHEVVDKGHEPVYGVQCDEEDDVHQRP